MATIHKSWIEKLDQVRNLLQEAFPEFDMRNMQERMSKIAHYHYNKRNSMLLGQDRKIYDLLITNSYNPYTVYRWLLLDKIPEDIRFQLNQNQISQKKAFSLSMQRKRMTDEDIVLNIRQMGMQLVRCL